MRQSKGQVNSVVTYIALLRGINVGGNNKIDMKQLKIAFDDYGFSQVRNYINSGNVVFSSDKDAAQVQGDCETLIFERFNLKISVAILTAGELADALNHAPGWWGKMPDIRHNAIFVIPPTTVEEVCADVGEIKPEYEKYTCYGKLIFWSAPTETFSRTRWGTVSKREIYQKITVRNSNTVYKLAELAGG